MKINNLAIIFGTILACTPLTSADAACDICNWRGLFESKQEVKPQQPEQIKVLSNDENIIGLQHLNTRRIVRCHNNNLTSAEDCARYFEKLGFVRFRDIPYKTANYDFLHVDTYPTRRWRDSELTSRW